MSYAIMRIAKVKGAADIGSRAAHNLRENASAAPHADPAKRSKNSVLVGPQKAAELTASIQARLDGLPKFRKDAVRAVELVLTASPEFFDVKKPAKAQWQKWLEGSQRWLADTFGQDNLASVVLHLDEATPHLQVLLVPVHEGKLRAAHWFDGPKKLAALQTSYAKAVEPSGLRRGHENSPATHTSLKAFYSLVNRITRAVQATKAGHEAPALPERGMLGTVKADDWRKLQGDLERYGKEGLRLRAESVAASLIASSEAGQEAAKRAQEAEKRRLAAEVALVELKAATASANALLAQQRAEFNTRSEALKQLEAAIEERSKVLKLDQLERYRDLLTEEIQALERRRPTPPRPR